MSRNTSDKTSIVNLPEDEEFRAETLREKIWRKGKENPFVPIGFTAVILSFYMASRRMREQRSLEMNYWLRARVITQGFTILALSWSSGVWEKLFPVTAQGRPGFLGPLPAASVGVSEGQEARKAQFDERMRRAEEAHQAEMAGTPKKIVISSKKAGNAKAMEEVHHLGGGYWRWLRWGSGSEEGKESSSLPAPPPQASPLPPSMEKPKQTGSWLRWVSGLSGSDKNTKS